MAPIESAYAILYSLADPDSLIGGPILPDPSPPSPALSLPFPPLPFPLSFPSLPLEGLEIGPLNIARASGGAWEAYRRKSNLVHLPENLTSLGINFTNFPENQLTTVYAMAGLGGMTGRVKVNVSRLSHV